MIKTTPKAKRAMQRRSLRDIDCKDLYTIQGATFALIEAIARVHQIDRSFGLWELLECDLIKTIEQPIKKALAAIMTEIDNRKVEPCD